MSVSVVVCDTAMQAELAGNVNDKVQMTIVQMKCVTNKTVTEIKTLLTYSWIKDFISFVNFLVYFLFR